LVAELLRGRYYTYLPQQTVHQLHQLDQLALRLFLFLESEYLPRPWLYGIFEAKGGQANERGVPALAHMLRLDGRPRDVRRCLLAAAQHLTTIDPRYQLGIKQAQRRGRAVPGMFNFTVRRRQSADAERGPDRAREVAQTL
ncbi:MAG: hypothetical protein JXB46_10320, partial [Candidatus Eisenbacteria bacterium]|nr:hypothetical protein [Candidatus Eisenbacteria bacterium]